MTLCNWAPIHLKRRDTEIGNNQQSVGYRIPLHLYQELNKNFCQQSLLDIWILVDNLLANLTLDEKQEDLLLDKYHINY